jgi:hypothetical protein
MSEIVLRDARYSELPEIAHTMSEAFWKDNLFGELIHPHRNEYPNDVDLYWLRRARVNFWDYRCRWLIAVAKDESGQKAIAGVAQWARLGDGGQKLECRYLDPRECLISLASSLFIQAKLTHRPRKPSQAFIFYCHEHPCLDVA